MPSINSYLTIYNTDGTPAAGAMVRFFDQESNGEKDVFNDPELTRRATQPVETDSQGRVRVFGEGIYRIRATTTTGILPDMLYDAGNSEPLVLTWTVESSSEFTANNPLAAVNGSVYLLKDGGSNLDNPATSPDSWDKVMSLADRARIIVPWALELAQTDLFGTDNPLCLFGVGSEQKLYVLADEENKEVEPGTDGSGWLPLINALGQRVPIGTIVSFAVDTPPDSTYLKCDGQTYIKTNYQSLADHLGETFSVNDDRLSFRVPEITQEGLFSYIKAKLTDNELVATGFTETSQLRDEVRVLDEKVDDAVFTGDQRYRLLPLNIRERAISGAGQIATFVEVSSVPLGDSVIELVGTSDLEFVNTEATEVDIRVLMSIAGLVVNPISTTPTSVGDRQGGSGIRDRLEGEEYVCRGTGFGFGSRLVCEFRPFVIPATANSVSSYQDLMIPDDVQTRVIRVGDDVTQVVGATNLTGTVSALGTLNGNINVRVEYSSPVVSGAHVAYLANVPMTFANNLTSTGLLLGTREFRDIANIENSITFSSPNPFLNHPRRDANSSFDFKVQIQTDRAITSVKANGFLLEELDNAPA